MLRRVKIWCCLAAFLLLLLPSAASAGDIQINSVCVLGTCPPPSGTADALQLGQSMGPVSGSYLLTFANTDAYTIAWSFSAAYTAAGTSIVATPSVTYMGSSPSVGNDVITVDFFQNYYDASPGSWDGSYTETVPFTLSNTVAAGSTASAQLSYDGQGLGLVGPFGAGSHTGQKTATLTGLTDPTLSAKYEFTFSFAAGTSPGASAVSSVPEPYQALPLGLVLAAFLRKRMAVRRSSSCTK